MRPTADVVASGPALAEYQRVPMDDAAPSLDFAAESGELPTRSPFAEVYETAPEQLRKAEQELAELRRSGEDGPALAAAFQRVVRWQLRADRMERYRGKASLPVESFAIRLGDAAIAAVAGEPYSRIGVEVKAKSPFPGRTLTAGYVGGDMMYIPAPEAFAHTLPPMQVDNSPYAPGAALIARDHLLALLQRVKSNAGQGVMPTEQASAAI